MQVIVTDKGFRYHVTVISDYHIEGSFDPEAPSDLDYYGYRDTEIEVERVEELYHMNGKPQMWIALLDYESEPHIESNIDKITLLVQDAIDILEEDTA